MLVCNVSLLRRRAAIAADVAEAAAALDAPGTGNVVFATLVDDPASVNESVDAYLGEIMLEAASADAVVDANIPASYAVSIIEAATAAETLDGTAAVPTMWNPADKSTNAVVGGTGNLTASASAGGSTGVRSTKPLSTGKVYFEITINNTASSGCSSGIAKGGVAPDLITGNPANGGAVVIWVNGAIWAPNNTGTAIAALANGSVLCVAADIGAKLIWFRKNAGTWNNSGTADPATAVGGISTSALPTPYYAFTGTGNGTESSTANFGATAFTQAVPSGFVSWDNA
jgi:hypothetical protein